jgi:hypothetical protein
MKLCGVRGGSSLIHAWEKAALAVRQSSKTCRGIRRHCPNILLPPRIDFAFCLPHLCRERLFGDQEIHGGDSNPSYSLELSWNFIGAHAIEMRLYMI